VFCTVTKVTVPLLRKWRVILAVAGRMTGTNRLIHGEPLLDKGPLPRHRIMLRQDRPGLRAPTEAKPLAQHQFGRNITRIGLNRFAVVSVESFGATGPSCIPDEVRLRHRGRAACSAFVSQRSFS
jgi:hypothetical protein